MGGDRAPGDVVEGAVEAHREGANLVLVGDESAIARELEARSATDIRVVHAPQVIEMGEDPAKAIRAKRQSSISICGDLVASGECSGMVSAGSTGAAVTAAVLKMGRIRGVERPAIASVIPFPGHPLVLCDSGANPECKPRHLAQFAIMGALFSRHGLGVDDPRVGLLNIGEEEGKGAALHKESYALLGAYTGRLPFLEAPAPEARESTIYRFVGNVEGYHLPIGAVDVAVTDGFTGNVVLKIVEGTAKAVVVELLSVLSSGRDARQLSELAGDFREVKRRLNPEGAGGAYLLGVKGTCVISHGSASPNAIKYAIKYATQTSTVALVDDLTRIFGRLKDAQSESAGEDAGQGGKVAADASW